MIEVLVVPEHSSGLSVHKRQKNGLKGQKNLKCSLLAFMIEVLVVLEHSSCFSAPKRQSNDLKEQRNLNTLTLGFGD